MAELPAPSLPSSIPILAATKIVESKQRKRSPNKTGAQRLDQGKSDAAVDLEYLRLCDPPVKLKSFAELRIEDGLNSKIPREVCDLREKLLDTPYGIIPRELEVSYSMSNILCCESY